VAALKRDDRVYTIALLGCGWPYNKNYKWKDSKMLFNYGINEFEKIIFSNQDIELPQILIKNGYVTKKACKDYSMIGLNKDIYIDCYVKSDECKLLARHGENIEYELKFDNVMNAPVKKGQIVGKVIYKIGDEQIKEYNLYSDTEVNKVDFEWVMKSVFKLFLMN